MGCFVSKAQVVEPIDIPCPSRGVGASRGVGGEEEIPTELLST